MSAAPRRPGPGAAIAGILGIAVTAGLMLTVGIVPAVALTNMGTKSGIGLFNSLPDDYKIATNLQQKTEIYAKRGGKDVLLASFYNQNRELIGWDDVPDSVKHATLAAEDARYYDHGGVDPMGILRAIGSNVMHGGAQGASTITQQYVKNICVQEAELLPTQAEVTAAYAECTGGIKRKLREARLAIGLEKVYKKDDILLGYLNIAGFGGRIYGIEAAAQYYFGTHTKDLTDSQAASLMAIVNSPNTLRIDEDANVEQNTVRRNYILKTELQHKMISRADYQEAVDSKVKPKITPTTTGCAAAKSAAYFCDYVVNVIRNDPAFGKTAGQRYNKLQSAGWKIHTTLDLGLQKSAKEAMTSYVPSTSPAGTDLGGAAVSVEVGTGRILSMVQSKRYDDTGGKGTKGAGYTATAVNWNTDRDYGGSSGFQPGSTYKTFTLIDWLEKGHGLYETVDGSARTVPYGAMKACKQPAAAFPVGNDEAGEGGYQTVMSATARSVNGAYASMAEKLDLCDIKERATDLLVHRADGADLKTVPSSILGINEVAPLSMATAYAGIANKGEVCASIAIDKIETTDGTEVPLPKANCHQAIPQNVAVATGYALHGVLTGGTARADVGATGSAWGFAKTGTTDDAKSTWVVGGTTKTVTAVWVGNVNAQKTNLRQIYGWSGCGLASNARHCLWTAIQKANQAAEPGLTTWPQPDQQFLYGQQTPLPDVAGKSVKDAKAALQQAGFRVKKGGETPSDTVAAGSVVSTDPAANTPVSAGTVITLTVSSGPQQQQVAPPTTGTVPPVNGFALTDARNALTGVGFGQQTVTYTNSGAQGCLVTGTNPAGGTPADPATTNVGITVDGTQALCP